MIWLVFFILWLDIVAHAADKVEWKYCGAGSEVVSVKAMSSEDGHLSLVGTPNMDIRSGSYRVNVQRITPFGDVSVLAYDGDLCAVTDCPLLSGREVTIKSEMKDQFVPPGDYKAKIQIMMRPSSAAPTEAPKELCLNVDVSVPRKLLARTMESTCSRKFCRQSPIDIKTSSSTFELPSSNGKGALLDVQYAEDEVALTKIPGGGSKVAYKVESDKKPTLEYNGKTYALANVHMHVPSEHAVDGMRYPAEVHLVHEKVVARPDGEKDYLVQGFFLEHADKAKEGGKLLSKAKRGMIPEMFDSLIEPAVAISEGTPLALRMSKAPFETSKFWVYPGSLTTPPYSADVTWVVYADPVYSSALKAFAPSAQPNARTLQSSVANAEVLTFAAKTDSKS